MRIGLNAVDFFPGRMGGIEVYFRNLCRFLCEIDPRNRYTLFCVRPHAREFPPPGERFGVREFRVGRRSPGWFLRGAVRRGFGIDLLGSLMARVPLDLIHHPFSTINQRVPGTPAVLSVMDLQHEYFPEFFPARERGARRERFRTSARAAVRILAISEYTRRTLHEHYEVPLDRIDVTYLGHGPEFRRIEDESVLCLARVRFGLQRPFLFYPAATWPHKNHEMLLRAFRILRRDLGFDGDLVLTGIAKEAHGTLMGRIRGEGLEECVKVLGYVDTGDLPLLYNLARALVFPSLFEGFGMPLVEAMACGCPVVASRATSIPEVVGDAAVLVDPSSPDELAEAVARVLGDGILREKLRVLGIGRAARFTWEETARRTVEGYERAFGSSSGGGADEREGIVRNPAS